MYNFHGKAYSTNFNGRPQYQHLEDYPKAIIGLPTPTMEQIVITPENDRPSLEEVQRFYEELKKNESNYYQLGNAYEKNAFCSNNPNCLSTSPLSSIPSNKNHSLYQATHEKQKPPSAMLETIGRRRPERRRERRQDRRQRRRDGRRDDPIEDDETCDKLFAHCEELGRYGKCASPNCRPCEDKKGQALDYAGSGCVPQKDTGCYEFSGCPL